MSKNTNCNLGKAKLPATRQGILFRGTPGERTRLVYSVWTSAVKAQRLQSLVANINQESRKTLSGVLTCYCCICWSSKQRRVFCVLSPKSIEKIINLSLTFFRVACLWLTGRTSAAGARACVSDRRKAAEPLVSSERTRAAPRFLGE